MNEFFQDGLKHRHNPYFNRWFSAITKLGMVHKKVRCHNPYFNRWFSAMITHKKVNCNPILSQSLF